jgi:hypothetical protein
VVLCQLVVYCCQLGALSDQARVVFSKTSRFICQACRQAGQYKNMYLHHFFSAWGDTARQLTRPLTLFLAKLDDGVVLKCLQLHFLLLGGLELFAQPIQLGCQLLVLLERWFSLVKSPLTVLRRLHDIL